MIVIIICIIIIAVSKNSSNNNAKIKEPKLTSEQKYLINLLSIWFPDMDEKVIFTTVTKWGNGPKFTFPIEGICKDGELVQDVLKRLEIEGNLGKILYFKKYMNIE